MNRAPGHPKVTNALNHEVRHDRMVLGSLRKDAVTIDKQFSRAVVAYIGKVGHLDTRTAEDRVIEAVGDPGRDLVPGIKAMLDDLHSAQPPLWNSAEILEVKRRAAAWLRDRHPELCTPAINAVSNQFAFDWK